MTTFQFDQCFNDKRVIIACSDEGLAIALRLPRDLVGKSDPELLSVVLRGMHPLVTLDRALPAEHTRYIPNVNPGIIVVNYSRDVPRTITTGEAAKILKKFKQHVAAWHEQSVQNSILEITEKSVEIGHAENGYLVRDGFLEFDDDSVWVAKMLRLLHQNAQRFPANAPSPAPGQTDLPA